MSIELNWFKTSFWFAKASTETSPKETTHSQTQPNHSYQKVSCKFSQGLRHTGKCCFINFPVLHEKCLVLAQHSFPFSCPLCPLVTFFSPKLNNSFCKQTANISGFVPHGEISAVHSLAFRKLFGTFPWAWVVLSASITLFVVLGSYIRISPPHLSSDSQLKA